MAFLLNISPAPAASSQTCSGSPCASQRQGTAFPFLLILQKVNLLMVYLITVRFIWWMAQNGRDQHIIDFIVSQYHTSNFESTPLPLASRGYQDLEPTGCDYLPPTSVDHQTLQWDISAEQFRLFTSSLNLFSVKKPAGADVFFEGSTAESFLTGKLPEPLLQYEQPALMTTDLVSSRMKSEALPPDMEMREGGKTGKMKMSEATPDASAEERGSMRRILMRRGGRSSTISSTLSPIFICV